MTGRLSRGRLAALFGALALVLLLATATLFAVTSARTGTAWAAFGVAIAIVLAALGAVFLAVSRAYDAVAAELREEVEQRRRLQESQRVLAETAAAEARLRETRESQSLENLGHVASGVAHDFNNLLGLILNFTGFVEEEIDEAALRDGAERWAQARKDLLQVQQAAERGGNLTKKLRAFARHRSEAAADPRPETEPTPVLESDLRGRETLLVVEDEDGLREAAARMLGRHGYRVLSASGGVAALEMLAGFDGVVDLLITDVVMPDMLGREFAEKARLLRPASRVLYISGHGESALTKQGRITPGHSLLEKPFTERALLAKVRGALGAIEMAGGTV